MNESANLRVRISPPDTIHAYAEITFPVERDESVDVDTQVQHIVEHGAKTQPSGSGYRFYPPHRIMKVSVHSIESKD